MSEVRDSSVSTLVEAYEKNKNVNPEKIQELRVWITAQPHLPHEHILGKELTLCGAV